MSKLPSRIALFGGAVVVIVAIAAVVVLGQLGRLIERGIEEHGPGLTGTEVSLGGARVSVFSGEGELSDLRIGNPQGYSDDRAFDLGRIKVAIDPKSVAGDVIRIRQVVVDGPRVLAEFDASGRNNLKAILNHVKAAVGGGTSTSKQPKASGEGKRMIIDEFRFENAEARVLAPQFKLDKTLKLRPIVLRNLGAKQGGAAAADIANQVLRPVVDATVQAATREYLAAQRGKLGDKAKDKAKDELNKLFN
jgi:hypothetical protein